MSKQANMKLVLVEWVDSYGCSTNWRHLKEIDDKRLLCKTVGWILREDDDRLVIVPHITCGLKDEYGMEDECGCGDMTIPKEAVKKVTELTLITPEPKG